MENFGDIMDSFKNIASDMISERKSISNVNIKKFIKEIKTNRVLRNQYILYTSISNMCESSDVKVYDFLRESIGAVHKHGVKSIKENNVKLYNLLTKITKSDINIVTTELNKNIHYLIANVPKVGISENIMKAKSCIFEHVKSNSPTDINQDVVSDFIPNNMLLNILIEKVNKKYDHLDLNTKKLINSFIVGDALEKSDAFGRLVSESVLLVNENISNTSAEIKEKLLNVKERLLLMKFNEDTFLSDVDDLLTLNESFAND